jgi:2-iminobutanoate/2-iminopropanoate deaminase
MIKKAINSDKAPEAVGPYSHSYLVGETLYISGQLGINPKTMGLESTIQSQTKQALHNIKAILVASGMTKENIVKTTIFLTDMTHFKTVNEIYTEFFNGSAHYPARSCVEINGLPKNAMIEIEAIAVK